VDQALRQDILTRYELHIRQFERSARRRSDGPRTLPHLGAASSAVQHNEPQELSHRELEVLILVADGLTNGEIATTLCISHHTVISHTRSVISKLGVSGRAHAVTTAFRAGIIT